MQKRTDSTSAHGLPKDGRSWASFRREVKPYRLERKRRNKIVDASRKRNRT